MLFISLFTTNFVHLSRFFIRPWGKKCQNHFCKKDKQPLCFIGSLLRRKTGQWVFSVNFSDFLARFSQERKGYNSLITEYIFFWFEGWTQIQRPRPSYLVITSIRNNLNHSHFPIPLYFLHHLLRPSSHGYDDLQPWTAGPK